MPTHNKQIAEQFQRLADLLEIQDANPFRVRAYRTAAQTIESLPRDAQELLKGGEDLAELPGIGDDLAEKISEIVNEGELPLLREVEQEMPPGLGEMMKLPGLGPKRVKAIHTELDIESMNQLRKAAEEHRIQALKGFGRKTEEKILREIRRHTDRRPRTKLVDAEPVARSLETYLSEVEGVKTVVVAGSFRRRKETVGDLDILITCTEESPVMDRFVGYEDVDEVVEKGHTRSTVILQSGLQVDLRVVPEACYGAALYYFTGSKEHNIAVRKIAQKKHLKINEYGVFKGKDRIAGKTEEQVFAHVGLSGVRQLTPIFGPF